MTDLPDVATMTAEAVRRELFSLLGGTLSVGEGDRLIIQWNGVITQTTMYAAVDPLVLAGVPDWPHDSAAALALCLEIARTRVYRLELSQPIISVFARFIAHDGVCAMQQESDEDAEDQTAGALARLALAALRGSDAR